MEAQISEGATPIQSGPPRTADSTPKRALRGRIRDIMEDHHELVEFLNDEHKVFQDVETDLRCEYNFMLKENDELKREQKNLLKKVSFIEEHYQKNEFNLLEQLHDVTSRLKIMENLNRFNLTYKNIMKPGNRTRSCSSINTGKSRFPHSFSAPDLLLARSTLSLTGISDALQHLHLILSCDQQSASFVDSGVLLDGNCRAEHPDGNVQLSHIWNRTIRMQQNSQKYLDATSDGAIKPNLTCLRKSIKSQSKTCKKESRADEKGKGTVERNVRTDEKWKCREGDLIKALEDKDGKISLLETMIENMTKESAALDINSPAKLIKSTNMVEPDVDILVHDPLEILLHPLSDKMDVDQVTAQVQNLNLIRVQTLEEELGKSNNKLKTVQSELSLVLRRRDSLKKALEIKLTELSTSKSLNIDLKKELQTMLMQINTLESSLVIAEQEKYSANKVVNEKINDLCIMTKHNDNLINEVKKLNIHLALVQTKLSTTEQELEYTKKINTEKVDALATSQIQNDNLMKQANISTVQITLIESKLATAEQEIDSRQKVLEEKVKDMSAWMLEYKHVREQLQTLNSRLVETDLCLSCVTHERDTTKVALEEKLDELTASKLRYKNLKKELKNLTNEFESSQLKLLAAEYEKDTINTILEGTLTQVTGLQTENDNLAKELRNSTNLLKAAQSKRSVAIQEEDTTTKEEQELDELTASNILNKNLRKELINLTKELESKHLKLLAAENKRESVNTILEKALTEVTGLKTENDNLAKELSNSSNLLKAAQSKPSVAVQESPLVVTTTKEEQEIIVLQFSGLTNELDNLRKKLKILELNLIAAQKDKELAQKLLEKHATEAVSMQTHNSILQTKLAKAESVLHEDQNSEHKYKRHVLIDSRRRSLLASEMKPLPEACQAKPAQKDAHVQVDISTSDDKYTALKRLCRMRNKEIQMLQQQIKELQSANKK